MKVTIIIPNYNGKHFLKACLQSLELQTFKDFHTIVVDNASTDGSEAYIHSHFPTVSVISLDKNYGFSRTVNEGIKRASSPYVILLNNDTVVDKRFVAEMVYAIEQSPLLFSVSSKMIQMNQPDAMDNGGNLYTLFGWSIHYGEGLNPSSLYQPAPIFAACAGAAIYRCDTFKEIGYFDESFFAYLEDMDIGFRAKIFGYNNSFCPTAIVHHIGSGTTGSKYNALKVRLSARNNLWLIYKNLTPLQFVLNLPFLSFGFVTKFFYFCRKGFGKEYLSGLIEGWKKRGHCQRIPFRWQHLLFYTFIQIELIKETYGYSKGTIKRGFNHQSKYPIN